MEFTFISLYFGLPLATGIILSVISGYIKWTPASNSKTSFPGPWQVPFIGRIHDLPRVYMWLKLKEWADLYGPIYQTSMMGQKFIVISDEDTAVDLLIKNGSKLSGRAQIRALIDHKTSPVYVALQDRSQSWSSQRRWIHAAMAASYQEQFHGVIDREVQRFLAALIVDPVHFHSHVRELTGRVMCTLSWDDAPMGRRVGNDAIETLTQMSIPGPIVNAVTPLWHIADFLGCNPWRRFEEKREGAMRQQWLRNFRVAKRRYLEETLPADTWAYRYCEQLINTGNPTLEQTEKEEDFACCMLGFQCMLGVVTVGGPLQYFLMAMALHPEWLKKAQKEIDDACGDRMPTIADYSRLPIVRACIKETLRWRPGVPLGVPHRCEESIEYRGVEIEKDTIVLACEWSLTRTPEKFPEPDSYRPDRWLEPGWPTYMEPLTRYPNLREGKAMHTFGWGRRQCLGQGIADYETFVTAAAICWGFDMMPKKCPLTGADVPIDSYANNSNVILESTPFPMDIRPRSDERAKQMVDQYAAIRGRLKV